MKWLEQWVRKELKISLTSFYKITSKYLLDIEIIIVYFLVICNIAECLNCDTEDHCENCSSGFVANADGTQCNG